MALVLVGQVHAADIDPPNAPKEAVEPALPTKVGVRWTCAAKFITDIGGPTDLQVVSQDGRWHAIIAGTDGAIDVSPNGIDRHITFDPATDHVSGRSFIVPTTVGTPPSFLQGGGLADARFVRLLRPNGNVEWTTPVEFSLQGFGGVKRIFPVLGDPDPDKRVVLCVGKSDDYAVVLNMDGDQHRIPWDPINTTIDAIDIAPDGIVVYGTKNTAVARRLDGTVVWKAAMPGGETFVNWVQYSPQYSKREGEVAFAIAAATKDGKASPQYWCTFGPTDQHPEWRLMGAGPSPYLDTLAIPHDGANYFVKICFSSASDTPPALAFLDDAGKLVMADDPAGASRGMKARAIVTRPLAVLLPAEQDGNARLFVVVNQRLWVGEIESRK